jgi:carboxymethylenebutenolidase
MKRWTAQDFQPEILQIFDRYVHGDLDRRGFLERAGQVVGGPAAAAGLLALLSPRFAEARQVAPEDPRIQTRRQVFESPLGHGRVEGLLARPASQAASLPAVLVVHENRGLNPHIEDIARRLAVEGFLAFAPDALAPLGGYPGDEDRAREAFARLDLAKTRADFIAAARGLMAMPESHGRVAALGFCFGGGIANMLATEIPELAAAVPFYGGQPAAADAARIKARLMLHYAGNDERTNAGWPDYEAALRSAGVPYEVYFYPGAQHGFHNDTTPRFDAAAAALAWGRTLPFMRSALAAA